MGIGKRNDSEGEQINLDEDKEKDRQICIEVIEAITKDQKSFHAFKRRGSTRSLYDESTHDYE